jgi:hypothetical protein
MSWLFSQALVEEYLGDTSLDGEQSVQSNGNPTPQAYCAPDKMTKFSRLSRFGMTYKPLTESRGEALLTLYREGFHARTFQPQEKAQELTENDQVCGNTWRGSLARLDQDTLLWRTAQCSLLEDLELSLQTFPRWGLMQNGALYPQQTLVQTISEKESGLWPTPNTLEGLAPKKLDRIMEYNNKSRPGRSYASMNLREQVVYGKVQIWPTPISSSGGPMKLKSERGKFAGNPLATAVWMERQKWPTPTANEDACGKPTGKMQKMLGNHPDVRQDPNGGTLNPTWVELLMGWPNNWSLLQPISHVKMCFWLMGFCDGKETRTREVLRVLRVGYATQEIQQEIGRPVGIYETAILLAQLCEYANRFNEAWVFMACAETFKEEMRGVQPCDGITSAPYQSEQGQQRAKEHPNIMQALSRLLAYYSQTAWQDGSWENAVPRVDHGVAARVDRLKAIGNGQVPLCAATAWGLLK